MTLKPPTGFELDSPSSPPSGFQLDQPKPVRPTPTTTPEPKLTRTWGETAKDLGVGVVQGTANLLGGTAELANTLTGGIIDKGVRKAQGAVNKLVNGGEYREGPGITGAYTDANADLDTAKSPLLRRRQQELADTEGFFASAKKVLTDPVLASQFVAEQVPQIASVAGTARATLVRGTEKALAKGATKEAAEAAGRRSLERQIIANEAVQEAGPSAMQTRQELEQLPQAVWDANPEYQQRVAAGESPDEVKLSMANVAAAEAAGVGGLAGAIGGRLTAGLEGRIFTRALDHAPLLSRQGAKELASTVGKEALEETVQEGGNQLGTNVGVRGVDLNRSLMEGVPEAAGTGAALGGLIGGGLHVAGAATSPALTRKTPEERAAMLQLAPPSGEPGYGTINVGPDGTATTAPQREAQRAEAEATGLTPDVEAARAAHPGAVPNAPPVPFPDAQPGSLADAANVVSANTADLPPPAPDPADVPPPAPSDATTTGSEVAPARAPLAVRMGGNEYPVESYEDASAKFRELRDSVDIGGMPVVELIDQGGQPVGYIGHGGEVYEGDFQRDRLEPGRKEPAYRPPRGEALPNPDVIEGEATRVAPAAASEPKAGEFIPAKEEYKPFDSAKFLTDAPVGHVATVESDFGEKQADGAVRWTKQADNTWTDGKNSISTERLAALVDETPDTGAIDGQATRIEKQAALPAPAENPVAAAAAEAATSPTNDLSEPSDAQKEAGNYKKGHVRVAGLDISIENPAGTSRRPEWPPLKNHYGYIKGTIGKDKDHVDVFLTDHAEDISRPVFVVDQYDPKTGKFDEHKVVLGAATEKEARAAYKANYAKDWQGLGALREFSQDEFKAWVRDPKSTTKPAAKAESNNAEPVDVVEDDGDMPGALYAEFDDDAHVRYGQSKDGRIILQSMASSADVRGRAMLRWLNAKYGRPIEVVEATQEAFGFWQKMLDEGLIANWGVETFDGRTVPVKPAKNPVIKAKKKPAETIEQGKAGQQHENATAPEHVTTGRPGISVDELKEMAAGWRGEIDAGKDAGVTHVFDSPKKEEVVRLNEKVKVYHKDHGWMTPAEAKKVIAGWKENAQGQGKDSAAASANSQKIVLSLFDLTGKWSQPWAEAGYEVWTFDIQDEGTYEDSEGNERKIGDVNNMSVEFFNDLFGDFEGRDIHAVLAACPCTDFAVSGARHFAAKDADGRTVASVELVQQTLALVEYYKPAVWAVENPVGRIESLTGLPPWRLSFDPNHLGDPYTKKTLLWGRFNADLPIAPVEPTEGSKMHRLYGGKSMATKNARSETPEGFSYGFFQANNAIDHPAQTLGWIYDRLPRALFDEAVAAGMTREDVANAVDDPYYIELDDEAAAAALREAISEKKNASRNASEPNKGKAKKAAANTEDAGQELYANRRNTMHKGLIWEDIKSLNSTLKVLETTKAKVWPKPDYQALIDGGMYDHTAHVIKQVYDGIAAKPQVRGTPTDEQLRQYIETVSKIRDATFAWAEDKASFPSDKIIDTVFPVADGSTRWRGPDGKANENNARVLLIGANNAAAAMTIDIRSHMARAQRAIQAGWPAKQEAWKHLYKMQHSADGTWSVIRARRFIERGIASREQAEEVAKAHYESTIKKKASTTPREARQVEQAERVGPPRRAAGEDVTSDRLREDFGFKGVNFGNWMKGDSPAKQRERQLHLNGAYDAFADLAALLNLPPKAMSLNGALGIAFGAQGSGGRAAAHFVPGVNEINLTRKDGAGGIAHEWAHALDHYFAVQSGEQAARDERPYLTQYVLDQRNASGVRPEIATAFKKIVNTMRTRPLPAEELASRENATRTYLNTSMDRVLTPLRARIPEGEAQALADFDAIATRLRAGDTGEGNVETGRKVRGLRNQRIPETVSQVGGELLELMRKHGARDEDVIQDITDADSRARAFATLDQQAAQRDSHQPQNGEMTTRSEYLREAGRLESSSGKPYWTTSWELFARAFESYVIDRLGDSQARNDYLSWPQMDEATTNVAKDMGLVKGDPYPRSAERDRINAAFDSLIGEIKTREKGDGNVALFSRPDPAAADGKGARSTDVRAAIAPIVSRWSDAAPNVVVVDTAHDLPAKVRSEKGWEDVEGWYDDKDTVYLVAGNLTSDDRARRILAHEAFGHFGIEAIVGEAEWAQIRDTVYRMMKSGQHNELFAEISRRYRGINEPLFVREAVAVMAEKGMGRGIVSRVVAAIRRFLRSIGFDLEFNERELRDLIGQSARYLRDGRRPRSAPERGAAMSFAARPDRDWDAKVPVVGVAGGAFGDTNNIPKARKAAKNYLTKLRDSGRKMTNADTGWRIGLSAASIKELIQFDAEKLNLLLALPRITNVAILADTARSERTEARDAVKAFHTFYAPVSLNGEPRIARLVVREDVNGSYAYDLQQSTVLKDGSPAFAGLRQAGNPGIDTGAGLAVTVRQLRDAVNAINRPGWNFNSNPDNADSEIDPDTAFVAGLSATERMSSSVTAFAEGLWRAMGTDSPFFRHWFGESKAVDKAGNPLKLYHGTAAEFAAFDDARLGQSTAHMSAALGFFFAEDKAKAQRYAEKAAAGVPADAHVYEVFLSIKNPHNMTTEELLAFESADEARAARARLQEQGHDGIHLSDIGQWIAFKPEQIKQTNNRGTFDPRIGGLLFSRPDPAATVDAMDQRSLPDSIIEKLRGWWNSGPISSTVENTRPAWLGALTLRHLAELGKDIKLSQVDNYAKRAQQMATDRNALQEIGAKVADGWEKFQRADKRGADETANLMHDTTIEGVDPSKDYVPMMTGTTKRGESEAVTAESIARRIAMVDKDLDEAGKDARPRLVAERDALTELLAQERARQQEYPELVRRFQALPEKGREVYVAARDAYTAHSDALEQAIIDRIEATEADGKTRAAYVMQVRQSFEDARIQGPYFPLARFGEFWISAEKDGKPAFFMYETVQEWRAAQADLPKRGFAIKEAGRKIAESRGVAGASTGFMADLEGVLKEAGVGEKVMDDVWQMYLRTLPDLSMRKHFIHRKKIVGYSSDALRAFSGNMFHGSFQIARVRHSHELESELLALKNASKAIAGDDPERAAKAAALTTELGLRHEWVMNPKDSGLVSKLTSLGFVWYLGMTPAAAVVNLTQTAIVTFPVLASRFGVARSWNVLSAAMGRALRNTGGDLTRGLSDEERDAFKLWQASGAIDRTMSHNLAGLSETDTRAYNPVARRAMNVVSWMFHHAEVVNREATALAAFRLSRADGKDFHTSVRYAEDIINESHFDYTNANRARFMQSNAAKVLLLFRQYSLNMTWLLWRNFYLSTKGESPEVKTEARKKLAGVLGMTAMFAGVMGLPLTGLVFDVMNAAAAAFGDDDEPFDAEVEFRNFLAELLGTDLARVLTNGPLEVASGVELGSRVGLGELWLRSPDRELEGQAMADYLLEQAAGPVVGGMLVNTLRGGNLMAEGHAWRGFEAMAPKSVKDAMKALRYGKEGVNTLRGDPMVEDLGLPETLLQLAGFSPADLTERYDANSAAKNYEQAILNRRKALLNAYAMSWRAEDAEGIQKALQRIQKWNEKHPGLGITMDAIRKSLAARMRYSARAEGGITLDRRIADEAREQGAFAE